MQKISPKKLNILWAISVIIIIVLAGVSHVMLVTAPVTPPPPPGWGPRDVSKIKVAFIAQVTIKDCSWDQAFWEALSRCQKRWGFTLDYTEGIYYGDYERVMRDYFARGYDVVVLSLGILVEESVRKVCADYPDRLVLSGCSVVPPAPNAVAICAQVHQSGYLAGMVAAWITKTNKVGMVGGMKIACCLRGYRGFQFGVEAMAKRLGKNVEYMEVMVGDYNDITKAYECAISLLDRGCDVVVGWQNIGCLGVIRAAEERGAMYMGIAIDQSFVSPNVVTCCKWVFPMEWVFEDMEKGTVYPAKFYFPDLSEGFDGRFEGNYVGITPFHEWENKIENFKELESILIETANKIAKGELVVPRIDFE
jgi:basic membrane lipoprotein Med (substrate-binding protein (PBP1-ABC) superfamily)